MRLNANLGLNLNVGLNEYLNKINGQRIARDVATKEIVHHLRRSYPSYNVMVVHSKHMKDFEKCKHTHIEIPLFFGTYGYEIYVFKRGHFTLLGDGGYINWHFAGNYKRYKKRIIFYEPTTE